MVIVEIVAFCDQKMRSIHRLLLLPMILMGCLMSARAGGTVVVLDPGHGGRDRGTMWAGVSEKTLTLNIAKKVEANLKARGIRTAMTRRTDSYRGLESRAAVANAFGRSVFVSIHCNADPHGSARGIETFFSGHGGRRLACCIHGVLDARTSTPDRGIKFSRFTVLRKTSCPAALVECGFVSSRGERRLLTTGLYQDRLARAIADGIVRALPL
jgi:N-acetylmuramoyl-L-alanine amidase